MSATKEDRIAQATEHMTSADGFCCVSVWLDEHGEYVGLKDLKSTGWGSPRLMADLLERVAMDLRAGAARPS